MADTDKKYDIAISFLHCDEPFALQLFSRVSESFDVFVYSKKQEELAGTDGLESFRQAFRHDSRLVVVLYRDGWGKSPWTRVEEAAIKDRFLEEGWDWLLFVMLDDSSTPPVWLPKSEIRLSFAEYGTEQLLGAIKMRAEKLGGVSKAETALERAKRLQQDSEARAMRERLLSEQGTNAFRKEHQRFFQVLSAKLQELNKAIPSLPIQFGSVEGEFVLRTDHVSVNLFPKAERRLVLRKWKGALILPQQRSTHYYIREPKRISEIFYYFDWQLAYEWCWHTSQSSDRFISTEEFAEQTIQILLDLEDKFERGEIRWQDDE